MKLNLNPCELNAIITGITNYLFINLSKEDFATINILVSELSKSMFSMEFLRGACIARQIAQKTDKKEEKD